MPISSLSLSLYSTIILRSAGNIVIGAQNIIPTRVGNLLFGFWCESLFLELSLLFLKSDKSDSLFYKEREER